MKQFVIMLVSCLLIASSSYSQVGYPKYIKIDSDSVVVITPQQVRDLNLMKVDYDECKETVINMQVSDSISKEIMKTSEAVVSNYQSQLLISEQRIQLAQSTITDLGKAAAQTNKQISWLKFQRNTLIGLVVGTIIYTVVSR